MEIEQSPVFFDHYLASSLGEWFAYYPGFLLPYDVFLNLLTSDQILCSKLDFFYYSLKLDPFLERCPVRKELDELFKIQKLRFIDLKPIGSSDSRIDTKYENIIAHAKAMQNREWRSWRHSSSKRANVDNLLYCSRNEVPFRVSGESAPDVLEVAVKCVQEGLLPSVSREDKSKQFNTILRWVFEVEVPALDSRTERIIDRLINAYKQTCEKTCETEEEKKHREEFLRKQFFNERVVISPKELLSLLADKKSLRALQEFLAHVLSQNLTQAGIRDSVRKEWDKLLGRLEISEWAFTGVNILTSPIPFSGAATSVGQVGVNRYLKSRSNWLLTLNKFNKHFRQTMKAN